MGRSLPNQERQHVCASNILSEDKHIGVLYTAKSGVQKVYPPAIAIILGRTFSLS